LLLGVKDESIKMLSYEIVPIIKFSFGGLGCSSVIDGLPSMWEALGLITSTVGGGVEEGREFHSEN
jgi:hypothetical protein